MEGCQGAYQEVSDSNYRGAACALGCLGGGANCPESPTYHVLGLQGMLHIVAAERALSLCGEELSKSLMYPEHSTSGFQMAGKQRRVVGIC